MLSLQSHMGEAEREVMEREVLGEAFGVDCPIEYGTNPDGTKRDIDDRRLAYARP